MTRMNLKLVLALAVGGAMTLSACDCSPTGAGGRRYPCTTDDQCANGFTCIQGECHRPGDIVDAGHLDFTTAAQTLEAGACSQQVALEARSGGGDPWVVATDTPVALTASPSAGFIFFADPACTAQVASATIPQGQSSTSFYFMGTLTGPVTVTSAAPSLAPGSQVENLVAAPGAVLAFLTAAQTVGAGACSGAVTLQSRDALGNPSSTTADLAISLSASPSTGFKFFSDSACTLEVAVVTMGAGANAQTFYFSGSVAGPVSLTAGAAGYTSATQGETITAGQAVALGFTTPAQGLQVGTCSSLTTVESQDAQGNPSAVGAATAVGLSAPAASGFGFYSDPGCTAAISSVTIAAGGISASFYFKGAAVGATTVTASAAALSSATQVESIGAGPPAALAFTTPAQTVVAGRCSSAVTVQSQDSSGNASSVTADATVSLSASPASGFGFYSNSTCTTAITTVTIAAGTNAAAFFYRGTVVSLATMTAAAGGLSSATQPATIVAGTPSALAFNTPAQVVTAGQCSGQVTVQSRDAFGNPSSVGAATTVALSASPSTGFAFYSNSTCTTTVTTMPIAAGASSTAPFYFRGTAAGAPAIAGAASGFTSAGQTETINPGAANRVAITTASRTITAGGCSLAVNLQVRDAFQNPTTVSAATLVTLTATPPTGFTFHTTSNCSGSATTVTIPAGGGAATFYFRSTAAGSPTVNVTPTGLTGTSQVETVNPGPPASLEISSLAQTVLARACSSAVTMRFRDSFGNLAPVAAATSVPLSAAPAGAPGFFSNASCATSTTAASFPINQSTANVYFRGRTGGMFTITASPSGMTAVSQNELILPTVRRARCSIAAGATSVTCPISPAQFDLAKTFMLFQAVALADADPSSSNVRCRLTSTSAITCSRYGASANAATIAWQTVELPSGISVQHVDAACGASNVVSVPIAAVASVADTFVLASHEELGVLQDDDDMAMVELTSPTNVNLTMANTCTGSMSIQVVEIPGISVTRGRVQLAPGFGGAAATGLPAASASTAVLHSHQTNIPPGGLCNFAVRGQVDSATSLKFTRGNGNPAAACYGSTLDLAYQRVDFGALATIQATDGALPSGSLLANVAFSITVDPTRTFVLSGGQPISGQAMGESDYAADDVVGEAVALHELGSPNVLQLTRGSANATARWSSFVIQVE